MSFDDNAIKEMCCKILTSTDMKAIAMARDFDKKCIISRDRFETYFHSVIGLNKAIEGLTPDEKLFLYYMGDEWVDTKFFAPLYNRSAGSKVKQYGTYTQLYSDTYKAIQNNFIRRGLLVTKESYGDSKLARWRYKVPELFSKHFMDSFIRTTRIDVEGMVVSQI